MGFARKPTKREPQAQALTGKNDTKQFKKTQNIESEKIIQNENSIIEKKQQDLPFKYAEEKNILEKINIYIVKTPR